MDSSQGEKDIHNLLHASSRRAKEAALKKPDDDVEGEHAPKGEHDTEVLVSKATPSNPEVECTPEVRHSEATPSKTEGDATPSKTKGEAIPSNVALEATPSNAALEATLEVPQVEAKPSNAAGEGTSNAEGEDATPSNVEFIERHTTQFDRFIERHHRIRETTMHYQLQSDLVEHLWDLHSKA